MQSFDEKLIQLAQQQRLLTRKQADLMRSELSTNPSADIGQLMVQKHYITEDQLFELNDQVHQQSAAEGISDDNDESSAIGLPDSYEANPLPDASTLDAADTNVEGVPQEQMNAILEQQRLAVEEQHQDQPTPPVAQPTAPVQQAAQEPGSSATPPPVSTTPAPPPSQVQPATADASSSPKKASSLGALLRLARHWGSSDLHLNVGRPPFVRLHGQIRYMEEEPLTAERSGELNFSALSEAQQNSALENRQIDFALEIPKVGRHRCCVFKESQGWCGSYRIINLNPSSLSELGLPETLSSFTIEKQGLIIVAGPAGSGKTSTVAALLNTINQQQRKHIVTIENPVELLLPPINCQVTQREIGRHTYSYQTAYKALLRQNPDVVFIGDMNNRETTALALSAADSGHLVFSTMNAGTTERVVAQLFQSGITPQQGRSLVAKTLNGIITQKLITRRDNAGQALAVEILINTPQVAQQIKDGKPETLQSIILQNRNQGMMLLDESLVPLLKDEIISGREAYKACTNKQAFQQVMNQD